MGDTHLGIFLYISDLIVYHTLISEPLIICLSKYLWCLLFPYHSLFSFGGRPWMVQLHHMPKKNRFTAHLPLGSTTVCFVISIIMAIIQDCLNQPGSKLETFQPPYHEHCKGENMVLVRFMDCFKLILGFPVNQSCDLISILTETFHIFCWAFVCVLLAHRTKFVKGSLAFKTRI